MKPSSLLFLFGIAAAALASVGLHYFELTPNPPATDRGTVFGTLAQVAGTMLGFMLAALAVVASISETELLKRMKSSGHYASLLQNLFLGALLFLGCAVLSLLLLLGVKLPAWLVSTLFGLHVGALIELLIVGWQFWLTLKNLSPADAPAPVMPDINTLPQE